MALKYLGNTVSGVHADKPALTSNEIGVLFLETDTGKIYQWDGDSWEEIVLSDASLVAKGIASFSSDNFAASSGAITIKNGGVILGTETTGNYVATVAGTSNEIEVSASTGTVTIGIPTNPTLTGNATITGNLIVNGDTITMGSATSVNSTNITIDDPIIRLATNNDANVVDIGFYGKYVSSGTKYAGLIRDADDNSWYLFNTSGSNDEPGITTNDILNISSIGLADLRVGNLYGTGINSTGALTLNPTTELNLTLTANTNNALLVSDGNVLYSIDTRNTTPVLYTHRFDSPDIALADSETAVHQLVEFSTYGITLASGTWSNTTISSRLVGVNIEAPTVNKASGNTVTTTQASTLRIAGPPTFGNSAAVTEALALHVDAGNVRFDGRVYLYDRGGEYIESDGGTLKLVGEATVIDSTGGNFTMRAAGGGMYLQSAENMFFDASQYFTWRDQDNSDNEILKLNSATAAVTFAFQQESTISTSTGILTIDGDDGIVLNTTGSGGITLSELVYFNDGTVSAPSISNTGDTNTGIYFPAADSIALTTDGTARLTIKDGNVGIGEAVPATKLHVGEDTGGGGTTSSFATAAVIYGTSSTNAGPLYVNDTTSTAAGVGGKIVFGGRKTTSAYEIFSSIQGFKENATSNNYAGGLYFRTTANAGNEAIAMTIASDGDVGIGITEPTATLHVVGDLKVDNLSLNGSAISSTNTNGSINIDPNGEGNIRLWPSGAGIIDFDKSNNRDNVTIKNSGASVRGTEMTWEGYNSSTVMIPMYQSYDPDNKRMYFGPNPLSGNSTISSPTLTIDSTNGRVGIGINAPDNILHLRDADDVYIKLEDDSPANNIFFVGVDNNGFNVCEDAIGTYRMVINQGGNVGIGTTNPAAIFHLKNTGTAVFERTTSATNTQDDGLELLRSSSGDIADGFGPLLRYTVYDTSLDFANRKLLGQLGFVRDGADNEGAFVVLAGTNGAEEFLRIDNDGTLIVSSNNLQGATGGALVINAVRATGVSNLQFQDEGVLRGYMSRGGAWVFGSASSNTLDYATLTLDKNADTVLSLDRHNGSGAGDNGPLIRFYAGGSGNEVGNIANTSGTVSYNPFTGAHYAITDESLSTGMLVSMTGTNGKFHDRDNGEILYGVVKSTTENDPKILGTYLGILDPSRDVSSANPHTVAAVGNGPMWIADKGANIAVGDYLISSDVAGHAMKDDGTNAVSYVIGRATETIDWSTVTDTVESTKHKLITVTYEGFKNLEGRLTALEARIAALEE